MVKWYKTYLEVYGKSFDEISDDSIRKVKRQLKERQNDSPLPNFMQIDLAQMNYIKRLEKK